jgi:hypothetical protein
LAQAVCEDHRVEQPVTITKNAAQASDIASVKGPNDDEIQETRRWADAVFAPTLSRARVFPPFDFAQGVLSLSKHGLRNPVVGANGLRQDLRFMNNPRGVSLDPTGGVQIR